MIKDVKFNGYTAVPSDYECPDGTLAASTNLVCEDSQIKPVFAPKVLMRFIDRGRLILIHHVPNRVNYIIQRGNALYWMQQPVDYYDGLTDESATLIDEVGSVNDVAIIGNTIAVATGDDIMFILWRDDRYIPLGSRPDFVPISFGLNYAGCLGPGDSVARPSNLRFVSSQGASQPHPSITEDKQQQSAWSNALMGGFLSQVKEKIVTKGYFYQPFFVRYAFRLFNGTYTWHSAPVLLIPTSHSPLVKATLDPNDSSSLMLDFSPTRFFELQHRITDTVNPEWRDIVQAIDIFVSAPIYTYDQSADVSFTEKLYTTAITNQQPVTPHTRGRDNVSDSNTSNLIYLGTFSDSTGAVSVDSPLGYYAHYHIPGTTTPPCSSCFPLPPNQRFSEQVISTAAFYKVASIPFDDIVASNSYSPVSLDLTDLSALQALPTLPDDSRSHCHINASHLYSFNSRLHAVPSDILPPAALPAYALFPASQGSSHSTNMMVLSKFEGREVIINSPDSAFPFLADTHAQSDSILAPDFPRFIFHPDPSATELIIYQRQQDPLIPSVSIYWQVPLKPHDFLNGSYWYAGMGADPTPYRLSRLSYVPGTPVDTPVSVFGKIYVSDASNPFIFPAVNVASVGSFPVLALSSTAKALSQGQFGQFPLYAFTSEGIWALEPSSTGSYTSRQPVSRDICTNPGAVTAIDGAVIYPTARGIMQLSGSSITCISDMIKSETPFDVLNLPHLQILHRSIPGHHDDNCIPVIPFEDFLHGCGLLYDYIDQRIVVFNPDCNYAYVYSLKSQQWGMMFSPLAFGVPSYPNAYAMMSVPKETYNLLVDFNESDEHTSSGILVTRPVKLLCDGANADILKTVDSVIVRGNFARGHVKTLLYGSRDLIHWHLVWSSKDHYLRGFRGTPYKYFRVACVTDLVDGESLFGTTFHFTPRLTDQPR